MALSANLVAELNTLLLYNVTNPQEGIKIHKDADTSRIEAARRLHHKGLITQADGGYLTDLGREAAEHLHMAHTILTTG
ncbi:MAG: hypothetical protein RL572_508 [Pseudomonadota bacterium]|jgi:uncharacterized protein (TIGR02647 family)